MGNRRYPVVFAEATKSALDSSTNAIFGDIGIVGTSVPYSVYCFNGSTWIDLLTPANIGSQTAWAATVLNVTDSRGVATTPQTTNKSVVFDFKSDASIGLSDGAIGFSGVMTFRPYGTTADWTGGPSHQLAFTGNGNVWHRFGTGTTWGEWHKLYEDSNSAYSEYKSSGFNGVTKAFATQFKYRNIKVYLNGVRLFLGDDYVETDDQHITFTDAPLAGDKVIFDYLKK